MRADELMIGDWVQDKYGNSIQVREILEDGINGECDNIEDYIEKTTGLFPMEETPEQFVKRYFGIK